MLVNDPIADMLTRIRNAQIAKHDTVVIPASNMKKSIAKILLDEGYIKSVDMIDDGLAGQIKIGLKYTDKKQSVIRLASSASAKPGLLRLSRSARSCRRCWAAWALRSCPRLRA